MDRNRYLTLLAEKIDVAYQAWKTHPTDHSYKQKYEMARAQLDNELKQLKDASNSKHHH